MRARLARRTHRPRGSPCRSASVSPARPRGVSWPLLQPCSPSPTSPSRSSDSDSGSRNSVGLRRLMNLNEESNLPTFYSSLLLVGATLLLTVLAVTAWRRGGGAAAIPKPTRPPPSRVAYRTTERYASEQLVGRDASVNTELRARRIRRTAPIRKAECAPADGKGAAEAAPGDCLLYDEQLSRTR